MNGNRIWSMLAIVIALVHVSSYAQNTPAPLPVDSMKHILAGRIHDTLRVRTLIGLAGEYYLDSPAKAITCCEEAKQLAEKISYNRGLSTALGWLAYLYEQQGKISTAIEYYKQSLALFEKLGDKQQVASCLNNIAAMYKDQGQIEQALSVHRQSLAMRKEINDQDGIATSYNNIGLIYLNQGRIPEALDYYMKSLKIEEQLGKKDGIATSLQNIGFVYKDQKQYTQASDFFWQALKIQHELNDKYGIAYSYNALGIMYEIQNKLDSALGYYEKSFALRTEINDKQGIAHSHKNMGNVFEKLENFSQALDHYKLSLAGFEAIGDKWGIASITNLYGAAMIKTGKYEEAQRFLERSLSTARELGYPSDIRNAASNLQRLLRLKNQWKQALMMNDLYIQMRDSVENENNRKVSIQTQVRYEYEKKEALLKSEQEKKDALAEAEVRKQIFLRNGFIIGFGVMLLFAYVFFKQRNNTRIAKQRSDELLLNILPEETAEELKATGTAQAKSFAMVSVLFTDFINFTQASEKLSPEDLVAEINYCYSAFDAIITKHGLEKIKTIGDAYMCAGGLPVTNTTHPIDIIQAGLEMVKFIEKTKLERLEQGRQFFELRCGIHTGPVVAGIVGIKKFAYDIWGDTVNTASRMESSGEAGKVNISETTYSFVKDTFICEYRGEIDAKNKGKLAMYFVEQFRHDS